MEYSVCYTSSSAVGRVVAFLFQLKIIKSHKTSTKIQQTRLETLTADSFGMLPDTLVCINTPSGKHLCTTKETSIYSLPHLNSLWGKNQSNKMNAAPGLAALEHQPIACRVASRQSISASQPLSSSNYFTNVLRKKRNANM